MDDRLLRTFIDPRDGRILLEIIRAKSITVKELCARITDVPRSTMYRILTKMERDGLIKVTDYRRVRGVVEKTYSPCDDIFPEGTEMTADMFVNMFIRYCTEYVGIFRDYAEENPEGIKSTVCGFYTAPVYADNDELLQIMDEIGKILGKYTEARSGEGKTLRSIGTIITPPRKA